MSNICPADIDIVIPTTAESLITIILCSITCLATISNAQNLMIVQYAPDIELNKLWLVSSIESHCNPTALADQLYQVATL